MNVPMIPLADIVAFNGSYSNHSSKKSAELIVISFVRYSNCSEESVVTWFNSFLVADRSDNDGRIALGAIVSKTGRTDIPICPIAGPNLI